MEKPAGPSWRLMRCAVDIHGSVELFHDHAPPKFDRSLLGVMITI